MIFLRKTNNFFLLLTLALLISVPVMASEIDFKNFKLIGKPHNYQVLTRVDFKLNDYLHRALLNGITLKARIQFQLIKHQRWWFDGNAPLSTINYQLKYHALSRHYLLTRNDTNEHWNFSTLPATLRKLGELRKYNLPSIGNPIKSGKYSILAVADMSPTTLKLPLRIQSFFSNKLKLTSKGVLWPLP